MIVKGCLELMESYSDKNKWKNYNKNNFKDNRIKQKY